MSEPTIPSEPTILVERANAATVVTLNRPAANNALSIPMLEELDKLIIAIADDPAVRAVVFIGQGRTFSVGADVNYLAETETSAGARLLADLGHRVFRRVEELGKPTVAAVRGLALGGGLELCLACDVRVAAAGSAFGLPEIRLGLLPGAGGTQRLPRLIGGAAARSMLLTGEAIPVKQALAMGLVNAMVPKDDLMDEALKWAERLGRQPSASYAAIKRLVREGMERGLTAGLAMEAQAFAELFDTADAKEGLAAVLEKRKPRFAGT